MQTDICHCGPLNSIRPNGVCAARLIFSNPRLFGLGVTREPGRALRDSQPLGLVEAAVLEAPGAPLSFPRRRAKGLSLDNRQQLPDIYPET